MEERTKTIIGSFLFIGLILVLGIGGYFYTFKDVNKNELTDSKKLKVLMKNKVDKNRDFIYYTGEQVISKDLNITFKNPRINLNNSLATAINDILQTENEGLRSYIKYISDTEMVDENGEKIEPVYDTDDIYSATIRNYKDYKYNQYISLVLVDYKYDCFKGFNDYVKVRSYVFDVNENKSLSYLDVLGLYDISLEDVKKMIKEKLMEDQTVVEEEKSIDIEETMNNLSNDNFYAFYIDENGKLIVNFIVNSNGMNYNDSIIIN